MHIALTVDPEIPVPPKLYGGIERIVDMLVRGLTERGHNVTLFAHPESSTAGDLKPYPGPRSQDMWDTVKNTLHVGQLGVDPPDIVHSFGRLAYLTPLLPLKIPKVMSYQREVSTDRVRWAMRLSRSGSLVFTGCSKHVTEQILPHAPAHTVYNGVPLKTYTFVPQVDDDAPLIFLGRIARIKGTHVAVEIARKSGRRLVIAGNVPDDEREYFNQYVRPHLNGDTIMHVGAVDDREKNRLLGEAAALLMPIDWEEPFGIVMAEAFACGTPVIGTRRGSVPEVVTQGETGFVCDTTDQMIRAVDQLHEVSRSACRQRCEEHFSDQAIVDTYLALYNVHIS